MRKDWKRLILQCAFHSFHSKCTLHLIMCIRLSIGRAGEKETRPASNVPLFSTPLRKSGFHFPINKVLKWIESWQWKHISMAGRVILLQSVCPSFLCLFYVSLSILEKIGKEFRAFLLGHSADRRGFHHIAWEQICLPKSSGGLRLGSLT